VLGVDLGSRRIGLALSDPTGTLATPLRVIERAATPGDDHHAILAAAREHGAGRIVVGWPRSLSGREGPAARGARVEFEALRELAEGEGVTVTLHDERFTTVVATRRRREQGSAGKRGPVDAAAAAVMLESYLESAR
jgi:putative Holliday junction resolvase